MNNFHKRILGMGLGLILTLGIGVGTDNTVKNVVDVKAADERIYSLVKNNSDITDGKYLIVYSGNYNKKSVTIAFDGSLKTLDCVGNYKSVTISGETISTTEDIYFTWNSSKKSLLSASGFYVGFNGEKNGMNTSETVIFENNISISADGYVEIKSGTTPSTLKFNNGTGNSDNRFRYFKTGQQSIFLYKEVIDTNTHNISISGQKTVEAGKTIQLEASCSKEDKIVIWESSDSTIATVRNDGIVTGIAVGKVEITVTCEGDGNGVYSINVISSRPEIIKGKTIAEVMEMKANALNVYEISGYVSAWSSGKTDATKYGNFYLKDSSISSDDGILVYGATATASALTWNGNFVFTNPQDFLTNDLTKSIAIKSKVTIYGYRDDFYDTKELIGIVTEVRDSSEIAEGAISFAKLFMNKTDETCADVTKDNGDSVALIWQSLADEYENLSAGAKYDLNNAISNNNGTTVEKAVARYEHIFKRYSNKLSSVGGNFMNRTIVSSSPANYIFPNNAESYIPLIVIVSLVSITLIGSMIIVRKRKVN